MSLREIANNSAYLILEKLVRVFTGVLVGAWVARSYGPSEFSVYINAVNVFAFFQIAIGLGLDSIVVRNLVLYESEKQEIINSVLSIKLIAAFVCIIGVVIYELTGISAGGSTNILLIIGLACMCLPLDVFDIYNQSECNFKINSIARLSGNVIGAVVKIASVMFSLDIEYVVLSLFAEIFVTGSLLTLLAPKKLLNFKINIGMTISLMRESWPYILSGIGVYVYTKFDQLLLNYIDASKTLGTYGAVLPFATAVFFVPAMISSVLAPYITSVKIDSVRKYKRNIVYLYGIFGILSWIIFLFNVLVVAPVYQELLGYKYQNTVSTFIVYTATIFFINLGIVQSFEIVNSKRSKFALFKTILAAMFSVFLNIIFVPELGMIGCAWAALFSQMISCWLVNIYDRELFKIQIMSVIQPKFNIHYRVFRYKYYAKYSSTS